VVKREGGELNTGEKSEKHASGIDGREERRRALGVAGRKGEKNAFTIPHGVLGELPIELAG